ncbi:MAG: energy transducer TonB [Bacteroidales bacterium]
MAKIDLNSEAWCNLVFEHKNKDYGAYRLRLTSGRRHAAAMLIIIILTILVIGGTYVAKMVNESLSKREEMVEVTTLAKLPPAEKKENEEVKKIDLPPPPALKSSIKFTPPVIKKDEEVSDVDEIKSQDELLAVKTAISIENIVGTDEVHGKDIAEVREVAQEAPKEEEPFTVVEQMPQYPGGEKAMMKFIYDHIVYPPIVLENGIQGKVTVRFVVSRTGSIEKVEVLKSIDPECSKEAIRVIKLMPKWIPGKQNGTPVPVYFILPVVFRLE